MTGILCIDKPQDFTSFDVVAVMRRALGTKKIGHTGTLDPMATGVLPLLIGRATRAASLLPITGKSYEASLCLGLTTDTQDIWGREIARHPVTAGRRELESLLPAFTGGIMQTPPMYSAVKIGGERLYDLARRGVEVERAARPARVDRLILTDADEEAGCYTLVLDCSAGTYVRTLIHDIGQALGCGAVMTSLRRTAACGFTLGDCVALCDARQMETDALRARMIPLDRALAVYPAVRVTPGQAARFRNGGALSLERLNVPEGAQTLRVHDAAGGLIGLGQLDAARSELKILRLF